MTITFEKVNDVIVYALEKVISYAWRTQQLFVAYCVWWLASIVGLEQGIVSYIDNRRAQEEKPITHQPLEAREVSSTPRNFQEDTRIQEVLDQAEEVIKASRRERRRLRSSGRVKPLPTINAQLKKVQKANDYTNTEGIPESEIARRKTAGECCYGGT
jgi:hypothetical protein